MILPASFKRQFPEVLDPYTSSRLGEAYRNECGLTRMCQYAGSYLQNFSLENGSKDDSGDETELNKLISNQKLLLQGEDEAGGETMESGDEESNAADVLKDPTLAISGKLRKNK